MKIGKQQFDVGQHTYVMGILNATPDSFSDGGKYSTMDRALRHVEQMLNDGADLIDVGGESTRPGYTQISDEEEIARTAPLIARIRKEFDPVLSIDTYKSSVALAAAQAGVDLINDIWGFRYDPNVAEVATSYGLACCLMHNRPEPVYSDFMSDVIKDLNISLSIAEKAGIPGERLILDPGVGFAKSQQQNLEVLREISRIQELGYPVLLGVSRKSVIGNALQLPVDERLEGTVAVSVYGCMKGCAFVRVHDVKENKRAIAMTEAVLGRMES